MSSVNKQILVGRLGKDPQVEAIGANQTVKCKFSIATEHRYKEERETTWHNVIVYGKQAESCGKYLSKGRLVYVEGRTANREYTDKQGAKQRITEVIADHVRFLPDGSKREEEQQSDSSTDVPF